MHATVLVCLAATSTRPLDSKIAQCEPWCASNDEHLRWCKCRSCSFARERLEQGSACSYTEDTTPCHSSEANDLPFESCSKWCKETYADAHCNMCACKACGFCKAALALQVPCTSFAPKGDTNFEIKKIAHGKNCDEHSRCASEILASNYSLEYST